MSYEWWVAQAPSHTYDKETMQPLHTYPPEVLRLIPAFDFLVEARSCYASLLDEIT